MTDVRLIRFGDAEGASAARVAWVGGDRVPGAEEPEIVGLNLEDGDGRPRRIGFTLGNGFSEQVTKAQSYLYSRHSKLRACSMRPELLIGARPGLGRGDAALR